MSNIKAFLILFIVCSFLTNGEAQYVDFDFDLFKVPDVSRKFLRVNPDLSLSTNRFREDRLNNAIADFDGSFSFTKTNRKKQESISAFARMGYRLNGEDISVYQNKFFGSLSLNHFANYFFKPKRYFHYDYSVFTSYDANQSIFASDTKDNPILFNVEVSPRIGFGRIENVTDLWHANSILRDLKEQGLLLEEMSEEELILFAEEVTRIKNTRRLDNRHESIAEYEQLLSYLENSSTIDLSNYRSFPVLFDSWRFESFEFRNHGNSLEIGLISNNYIINYDIEGESTRRTHEYGVVARYLRQNAISMHWQVDYGISLQYFKTNLRTNPTFLVPNSDNINANTNLTVGYYFSARTNLEGSIDASFNKQFDNFQNINARLSLSYNYYFSPVTRFFLTVRGDLFETDTIFVNQGISSFLSTGVNYYIF